jgi:hypothetical protein
LGEFIASSLASRLSFTQALALCKIAGSLKIKMPSSNVSADLIWEIVRECREPPTTMSIFLTLTAFPGNQNSYLVKRKALGGVSFSRDPLNLTNRHTRKVGNVSTFRLSHTFRRLWLTWHLARWVR